MTKKNRIRVLKYMNKKTLIALKHSLKGYKGIS